MQLTWICSISCKADSVPAMCLYAAPYRSREKNARPATPFLPLPSLPNGGNEAMKSALNIEGVTNCATDCHRWGRILDSLRMPPAAPPSLRGDERFASGNLNPEIVHIVILDRPSSDTVLVSWSSSIGCRYGEQTWRKVVARKSGVCILSGHLIVRGDSVFRPKRTRNAMCSNWMAMMKASSVDRSQHRFG
jgi:hypothetical protein